VTDTRLPIGRRQLNNAVEDRAMNAAPDSLLNRAEEKLEPVAGQEQKAEPEAALIDMGKVSDTQGGWYGPKIDTGYGLQVY